MSKESLWMKCRDTNGGKSNRENRLREKEYIHETRTGCYIKCTVRKPT